VIIKPLESLLQTNNNYSVMQQIGTSAFNTIVRWKPRRCVCPMVCKQIFSQQGLRTRNSGYPKEFCA